LGSPHETGNTKKKNTKKKHSSSSEFFGTFCLLGFSLGLLFGGGGGVECFVELDFLFTTFFRLLSVHAHEFGWRPFVVLLAT
jgi:hypothetical protein